MCLPIEFNIFKSLAAHNGEINNFWLNMWPLKLPLNENNELLLGNGTILNLFFAAFLDLGLKLQFHCTHRFTMK